MQKADETIAALADLADLADMVAEVKDPLDKAKARGLLIRAQKGSIDTDTAKNRIQFLVKKLQEADKPESSASPLPDVPKSPLRSQNKSKNGIKKGVVKDVPSGQKKTPSIRK